MPPLFSNAIRVPDYSCVGEGGLDESEVRNRLKMYRAAMIVTSVLIVQLQVPSPI